MRIIINIPSLIIALLFSMQALAQEDSSGVLNITKTAINYKSFVNSGNKLFAINDSGKLVIWDLKTLDTVTFLHNDSGLRYRAICKDRHGKIFIGTNKGDIFRLDPDDLSYSLFLHEKYAISSICFNSADHLTLIVCYVVYDPIHKRHWYKFGNHPKGIITQRKVLGHFFVKTKKYFSMPDFTYLDSHDKWWMCNSYGEWGGELEVFDTKHKKIANNKFKGIDVNLLFPKSVFEDSAGNIYITSGLQHMGNTGHIYKIDAHGSVTKIFDGEDYRDTSVARNMFIDEWDGKNTLFVGPGAYNKSDNSIYFATANGFYKAALPSTGKLQTPKLLFNPSLRHSHAELAVGISMPVKRMEFSVDNKLIFLTQGNGIGIYDNGKLVMLK